MKYCGFLSDSPTSAADSGSRAGFFPATSAAAGRVFAPISASVAGASARSADFSLRWRFVGPAAGGPGPAAAGVSGGPVPASRKACPAVAGISGPVSGFPCLEELGVDGVGDPSHELHWGDE